MSDPGAGPDPMDKAYVEAEAVLDDAEARRTRRARVLAAVAREPVMAAAVALPSARRPAWRAGRWLAAACVAGLGLLAVTQIYEPARRQTSIGPALPAPPTSAVQPSGALPSPPGLAGLPAPAPPSVAAPLRATPATPPAIAKTEPPPPPPAAEMPSLKAFPAAAPPAPPPPPPPSTAVTLSADQRDRDEATTEAHSAEMRAPAAGFAAQVAAPTGAKSLAGLPSDRAASLRAAAAAGRTAEVNALLAQGVPVDAPDAAGDTALMMSIQADQPATAALLRRHGASLDLRNHAGESARDMARAKGDAALDQAIGLGP